MHGDISSFELLVSSFELLQNIVCQCFVKIQNLN
jgi:hypothetical protein